MENHGYADVIGNGSAPYINSLRAQGASFTDSHAITHPSEPNYLALFAGTTEGISDDSCPHTFTDANLGSGLLASGQAFVGYSESMPSNGYTGCGSGDYARKHNPWVNYANVPASSNLTFAAFPADYSQLPTVAFVVPNLCNDMHDCSVATGDAWLQSKMDGYVQWAKTHNSLFAVTFDEDRGTGVNQIATIFVGPMVQPGDYGERIDHYTVLRTLEDMYGVPPTGNAATAASIRDVWSAQITPTPTATPTRTPPPTPSGPTPTPVPREPLVRIQPPGCQQPLSATTPLPDPSGAYEGTATWTTAGVAGTLDASPWRIDLQSRPCPDCDPGQYYFHSTNYTRATDRKGEVERGDVYGSVNPSGTAFDLDFLAANCPFLNPSGNIGGASYAGRLQSGSFGESPGDPLRVRDGTISGRISGRDCFGRIVTAEVSLARRFGTPISSCPASITGIYAGTFVSSCGASSGRVIVSQSNCFLSAASPDAGVALDGAFSGPTTFTFSLKSCGDTLTGSGSLGPGGTITGSYGGTSGGSPGCCPDGPTSGSFTLRPQ